MPDAVMLFAAGFGTRMGAMTQDRPKPLIPVAGRPLIEHAMQFVRETALKTTVVNAHYKADQILAYFEDTDVIVAVEHPDILDTGGGLKAALPVLQSDVVFTMNTDAVWKGPNPLNVLADAWTDDMQALLLCVPAGNAIGHVGGDFDVTTDGKASWGSASVYTGVQIIRTERVSTVNEDVFSLKTIWQELAQDDALHAVLYDGLWCDVGHPEGIALAENMLGDADV